MTAKELKEKINKLMNDSLLIEDIQNEFDDLFVEFSKQLCEEQRIKCKDEWDIGLNSRELTCQEIDNICNTILTASMPEL